MSQFGLALIYLKRALQQKGCPICRCCAEQEERYIRFLLWENVNDIETRTRLAESLGFCGQHAQQMLAMERDELGMILGNSIIYESLTHLALLAIRDIHSFVSGRNAKRRWLDGFLGGLRSQWASVRRPLTPSRRCRVCELRDETARHYSEVLVGMLSYPEFQGLYERSDGVCLPHLRIMLQVADPTANVGLEYLLRVTEERLERLTTDLRELGRKYSAQYRHESLSQEEALSVERAIAFFTGSALHSLEAA